MPSHASDGTASAQAPNAPTGPSTKSATTILVVDDRAINRDFLVSLLKYSYRVVEAESGEQAWGAAASSKVDLIITDIKMNGMDGFALLEKLSLDPATAEIPVILYTAAYKTPDASARARSPQVRAVLAKPTAPEEILKTVQSALGAVPTNRPGADRPSPQGDYRSTTLIEIMLDLAEKTDPAELLQAACDSVRGLFRVAESFMYMLPKGENRPTQTFRSPQREESPELLDQSRIGATLPRIIAGHGIGRFRHADPLEYGIPLGEGKVSSLLCLPIFTRAHDYGCLCMVDKPGGEDFNDDDERLGMTLSSQLATLYENAVFYEEIQGLAARLAHEMEDRKRTEEELDRSRTEQMHLKDQFLSHVSHELRSPLMTVQQFLEILQEGIGGEIHPQQREYVDIALRNTHQLNTMIGDLLETTRIEAGKLRVDLRSILLPEVLREAVQSAGPVAEQKQITLCLDLPTVLPPVVADRSRVRQIATNLLDNAIKFTDAKGSITVHAGVDEMDPKFVRVKVSDTGCGLSPKEMKHVFDRHYQVPSNDRAARKGLGLGLCICKELIALQGGQIEVESRVGAGSVFSFTLPVFSVVNLLTPILSRSAVAERVAIVSIEVAVQDGGKHEELLTAIHETIERCVLPDMDVVLPGSYTTRLGQMFLVAAGTSGHGAQVLATRIENQLKLTPRIADCLGNPLIEFSLVDLSVPGLRVGAEEQLVTAAVRVEEEIRAIIAKRS